MSIWLNCGAFEIIEYILKKVAHVVLKRSGSCCLYFSDTCIQKYHFLLTKYACLHQVKYMSHKCRIS